MSASKQAQKPIIEQKPKFLKKRVERDGRVLEYYFLSYSKEEIELVEDYKRTALFPDDSKNMIVNRHTYIIYFKPLFKIDITSDSFIKIYNSNCYNNTSLYTGISIEYSLLPPCGKIYGMKEGCSPDENIKRDIFVRPDEIRSMGVASLILNHLCNWFKERYPEVKMSGLTLSSVDAVSPENVIRRDKLYQNLGYNVVEDERFANGREFKGEGLLAKDYTVNLDARGFLSADFAEVFCYLARFYKSRSDSKEFEDLFNLFAKIKA